EPPGRRRPSDRRLVERVVEDLPGSQATPEELRTARDRDPVHVRENAVDADADTRLRPRKVRAGRGEAETRIGRVGVDLRAVHENRRMPAPPAAGVAPPAGLRAG